MKKEIVFVLAMLTLSFASSSPLLAQLKLNGVQLYSGTSVSNGYQSSLNATYQSLIKDSVRFNFNDTTAHNLHHANNGIIRSGGVFGANLLFLVNNKNKSAYYTNRMVRLGVQIATTSLPSIQNNYKNTIQIDSVAGNAAFMDKDSIINLSYDATTLGLQASYIFSGNAQRRFSLYGGLGAGLNTTINASIYNRTQVIDNKYLMIDGDKYATEGGMEQHTTRMPGNENQAVNAKRITTFQVFVPIGVQWRLSKKDNWLKGIYVSMELQGVLNSSKIQGGSSSFYLGSQSQFGISWRAL